MTRPNVTLSSYTHSGMCRDRLKNRRLFSNSRRVTKPRNPRDILVAFSYTSRRHYPAHWHDWLSLCRELPGLALPPKGARLSLPLRSCVWCEAASPPSQMIVLTMWTGHELTPAWPLWPCWLCKRPRSWPVTRHGPRAMCTPSTAWSGSRATRPCATSLPRSPPRGSARCARASCGHASAAQRAHRWCVAMTAPWWRSMGRGMLPPRRCTGHRVCTRSTATGA